MQISKNGKDIPFKQVLAAVGQAVEHHEENLAGDDMDAFVDGERRALLDTTLSELSDG